MKSNSKLMIGTLLVSLALTPITRAATINWTNTAGGNWSVAANWSPNQVPGASDTALITNNGTYTVTLNGAVILAGFSLGGESGTQTVNVAQWLTLNGPSSVGDNGVLNNNSGITGTGDLTVHGRFKWSGTLSGSGELIIAANGTLAVSGSRVDLISRTLVNHGTATWSPAIAFLQYGAVISNAFGATFDVISDSPFNWAYGALPVIGNNGTFRKTGGTGWANITAAFNNSGTVEVQSGTLILGGGGTSSGTFIVLANATLALNGPAGSPHNLSSSASVTGDGSFAINGGTANLDGYLSVTGTNWFSAGTANLNGTYNITNVLIAQGGTANFNGSGTITPVVLTISAGGPVFNGAGTVVTPLLNISGGGLAGTNTVIINGPFNWTGGSISGSGLIMANSTLAISGARVDLITRTLVNHGTATWSPTTAYLQYGAVLSNAFGATFDVISDSPFNWAYGGLPLVANNGTFRKTGGTGTANFGTAFNNSGMVEIQSGTLALSGGGTSGGHFTVGSPFTIVPSAAEGTGLANYDITYLMGSLTVNPAALTITANEQTKNWGEILTFVGTEFKALGLQNAETVGSVTLSSSGVAATANVATYDIIPSAASGGTFFPGNYALSYQNGTLTVNPSAATIACPASIITNSGPGLCGQTVNFPLPVVTGTPAPIVTCQIGGFAITSPFQFPLGTNQVNCTASNSAGTAACTFAVIVTDLTPPIPGTNYLATPQGQPATLALERLLLVCQSPRGTPLSIVAANPTTATGGTVSLGGGLLTYTPAAGFVGDDLITYTLSDGCGSTEGSVMASVTSSNLPPWNRVSLEVHPTSCTILYAGIPGQPYIIQCAHALTGPWSDLSGALAAAADGRVQYIDTTYPVPPQKFYRARLP